MEKVVNKNTHTFVGVFLQRKNRQNGGFKFRFLYLYLDLILATTYSSVA